MLQYSIVGDGYDAILVSTTTLALWRTVTQYYLNNGVVVKTTRSTYRFNTSSELVSVETDDTDTLILPSLTSYTVKNNFLGGHGIRRVVVPKRCSVHFGDRAFQDIPNLTKYISLSKDTTYGSDVFPETVTDRRF